MKKNIFYLMCGLLSFSMLFTACSTEDPIVPEFPSEVSQTIASEGTYKISINPNVKWSLEISNKTDFYLLDGTNQVYTMQGQPGEFEITVYAREIVDYDENHTCEVTLSMGNQTQKIATLTVEKIARELKVYPAVLNEDGAFVKEAGKYVYSETAANAITLTNVYGTFMTPVKVVSNFKYNVVGPEWMEAVTGGDANSEVELVFTADANNLPSDDANGTVSFIDANKEDKVGATITVAVDGSSEYMEASFFEEAISFSYEGGEELVGYISADQNAEVVAVSANGSAASWLTVSLTEWDAEGASIQDRSVTLSAGENDSAASRVAYIFALPAAVAVENVSDLVANGEVSADYADYFVMTVTQFSAPATIIASEMFEPAYMADANTTAWPFNEWALNDYFIGSAYELFYVCEWDSDTSFKASKAIKSFRTFAYAASGSFEDITGDDAWVKASVESAEANEWFKIIMDPSAPTAADAQNYINGDYEAVLLIEYTDGSYSAIYCRYNENSTGGGNDAGPKFAYPDYVGWDGTTLVELTEGELYNTYSEFGVPVYHLTYTTAYPSMSMFANLPPYAENLFGAEWLGYEYSGEEFQVITMAESGNGQTAPLLFMDETGIFLYVIVCTLDIQQ